MATLLFKTKRNEPQTIQWLRHGVVPLFVVEGATPPAKLERLRQRCAAAYGPAAAGWRVGGGNADGGRFAALGRKVTELLDLLVGVVCVCVWGEVAAACFACCCFCF